MSIHNTVPIQMYVRDLLTKKPSRSLRAFKETALNFFFNFFLLATSQKIIFAISLTAKNWTEIEKLRMRTWKLNTEFFKTVMWRFHGKRWDCTVTAAWQWTIKKENRHSFPAEKVEKESHRRVIISCHWEHCFPVSCSQFLILDPHKNLQARAHQGILSALSVTSSRITVKKHCPSQNSLPYLLAGD